MSQTVYREVHPPSVVTHCVEAYLTHAAARARPAASTAAAGAVPPNLVLARGTRLEVYALNYGAGPCLGGSASSASSSASSSGVCRLELVGSWHCWGVIQDLAVLRGKGSSGQRDSIIIAVRDAKLSLVDWDDGQHCLRNNSLHWYEDASLKEGCPGGTWGPAVNTLVTVPPRVAADPAGRCAAALLYGRQLAILPAFQADVLELLVQQEGGAQGAQKLRDTASVGNSYAVNLSRVTSLRLASATAVRGMAFLHGYTEPLLALLHETTPTWGARLRDARDACALSALSINIPKKRQPPIWHVPDLPSDACGLLAVPRGGVLVLSQNLLLYYAQGGSCVTAINSNAFAGELPPRLDPPAPPAFAPFPPRTPQEVAAATAAANAQAGSAAVAHAGMWAANVHPETVAAAARGAPRMPGVELEADGAAGCWLSDAAALLSLKTGQLLLVTLRFEGVKAANKMQVAVVGSAPVASCAVRLTSDLLFLGSATGDALLVRHSGTAGGTAFAGRGAGGSASGGSGLAAQPSAKRRRTSFLASYDMGGWEGGGASLAAAGSLATGASRRLRSSSSAGSLVDLQYNDNSDLYRSAMGRSSSAKLPALAGDASRLLLSVLDSLQCLGPMRSTALTDLHLCHSFIQTSLAGAPPADSDNKPRPCLLAAVGSDKSGALALLRRGLVADVVAAVPALSVHGAWSLHHWDPPGSSRAGGEAGADADEAGSRAQAGSGPAPWQHFHKFLLLSCTDEYGSKTMLMDVGTETLNQITTDDVAFLVDCATVAAGEMFHCTAAVQVTHSSVRLVRGSNTLLHALSIAELLQLVGHPAAAAAAKGSNAHQQAAAAGVCIRHAQVRAPHVLLLLSDASAILLRGDAQAEQLQLVEQSVPELSAAVRADPQAAVTAACIYTDDSGWMASALGMPSVYADGQQQQPDRQPSGGADVDVAMAEAAAAAPAAGQEDGAAAAAADADKEQQQAAEAAAAGDAGDPMDAEAAPAADDVKAEPATAAAAAAATAGRIRRRGALPPGLAANASHAGGAGVDDDADGVLRDADVAAAEAVMTEAAAAAVAAEDAAAQAGATPLGRAVAGAKAADAVEAQAQHEGAAAADAGAGAGAASAAAPPSADMSTPFQAAAAKALGGAADDGTFAAGANAGSSEQQQQGAGQPIPASFCCVMRADGCLQLFALPSMQCVLSDAEALLGPQVLGPTRPPCLYAGDVPDDELCPSPVSEMMLECFAGASGSATGVPAAAAPLLMLLRDDGCLSTYKAFRLPAPCSGGRLGFRRLPLDPALLGHESPAAAPARDAAATAAGIAGMPPAATPPCRLVRFDHLVTPSNQSLLGPQVMKLLSGQGGGAAADALTAAAAGDASEADAAGRPQLRYSGVFVCGPRPLWLVASRGGVLPHPLDAAHGRVDAFCGFHNVNCVHGFITAATSGNMNVSRLPVQLRLDQPWLTCKLPLRATPLALAVYPEAHLVAVATCRLTAPPRPFVPQEPGGDPVAAAAYATAEAASRAAGVEDTSEVLLVAPPGFGLKAATYHSMAEALVASADAAAAAAAAGGGGGSAAADGAAAVAPGGAAPGGGAAAAAGSSAARSALAAAAAAGWAGLPLWRHTLLPGEEVMALKCVHLHEGGNDATPLESYIAIGCASSFGEDYPALGRLLLLQVIKQQHFHIDRGTETRVTARLALQRDMAGPVTAIDNLRGMLILAVGHRVEVHFKQGNSLVKVTFFDGTSLMSSISLVKDFILVGTAAHSLAFLRYSNALDRVTRERTQQVQQLSCDTERLEVWAVEFLPNGSKLNQAMADGSGSISMFVYDREDFESWKGQKLLRRGAAHVGAFVTGFTRLKLSVAAEAAAPVNRQALLGATVSGGLLLVTPFWDDNSYKRMASLHEELVYRLPHTAGLNPKAFQGRYARTGPAYGAGFSAMGKPLKPADNLMLQGDVLWVYASLDGRAQAAIADAVGATAELLLADLRALTQAASFL